MPRLCTVCSHAHRRTIDAALIAGASLRDIAATHGLQPNAVLRHSRNHLVTELQQQVAAAHATVPPVTTTPRRPRALDLEDGNGPSAIQAPPTASTTQEATATAPETDSTDDAPAAIATPFALMTELHGTTVNILRRAVAAGDGKLALQAATAAVQVLDRMHRLMPTTNEGPALPLVETPEWAQVRSVLVDALRPHPDAAIAVAEALAAIEGAP